MKRWFLIVMGGAAAACGSNNAGPAPVACTSSSLTSINLTATNFTLVNAAGDGGCLSFPTSGGSAQYLVVPQSAGGSPGDSISFALQGGTAEPSAAATAAVAARRAQRSRFAKLRQMGPATLRFQRLMYQKRLAAARTLRTSTRRNLVRQRIATVTPPTLGSQRTFQVCNDYYCSEPSDFTPVVAQVQALGSHIALYVDTTTSPTEQGLTTGEINQLTGLFDTLYAVDTTNFGGVSDLDSNGVVIMLMTPIVNELVTTAECDEGGYVAGYFNPGDLVPGTEGSNDGEIFYTVVADPGGRFSCAHALSDLEAALPTTFLHELEHVVCFNQHYLIRSGPEESLWLDEALASYAEELGGRFLAPPTGEVTSISDTGTFQQYTINVLSDAYDYFQDPSRHFLLQESDTVLADFGAGWLYIRYLVDQYGPGITLKLEETSDTGTVNVAAQTGVAFGQTAGQWALANWVSDLPGFTPPPQLQYTSWSFRGVFASMNAQDPYDFPVAFPLEPTEAPGTTLSARGFLDAGSGAYFQALQSGPGFSMYLSGNPGAISAAGVPQLDIVRIQ